MLEKFRARQGEEGFTLVELLVVMLILGILAAIAIPAFFSQRNKGFDSNAKAQVRTTQTALESCATDNAGKYPAVAVGDACGFTTLGTTYEPTLSGLSNITITPTATTKGYSITGTSQSGNTYTVARSDTGGISNTCTGTACKW